MQSCWRKCIIKSKLWVLIVWPTSCSLSASCLQLKMWALIFLHLICYCLVSPSLWAQICSSFYKSLDVFYHNNRSVIDADAVLLTCQILHKVEPICSFFRFHLLYACKYFVLLSRQDTSLTLFYISDSFGSKLWIIGGTVLLLESLGLSLVLSINIFPSKRKWHNMERNENFSLSTIWAKTSDKKNFSLCIAHSSVTTYRKNRDKKCADEGEDFSWSQGPTDKLFSLIDGCSGTLTPRSHNLCSPTVFHESLMRHGGKIRAFNYFIHHLKISEAFHNAVLMNEQTLIQNLLILCKSHFYFKICDILLVKNICPCYFLGWFKNDCEKQHKKKKKRWVKKLWRLLWPLGQSAAFIEPSSVSPSPSLSCNQIKRIVFVRKKIKASTLLPILLPGLVVSYLLF